MRFLNEPVNGIAYPLEVVEPEQRDRHGNVRVRFDDGTEEWIPKESVADAPADGFEIH